ncbi:hypothetical protein pEaSNUABM28_00229 [Erwinia phage pEa_SNUABM_28]|uniref:Uncharacterized protein n=2 Tax=Alexandravirus TaxID=2733088 RepID=A0AAE9BUN1_9CAUD|nr:hypothetical protein MPK63_gp226 [Erwinia phage pEa_SNUABM_22]YP_010299988.1 hypothetical protein MPK64_gp227 [Erwinia phage pEa_SNUABM_16]QZE58786.1 hypothetical protein pEaSNUABM28_00229 [Erwinia phage pEa_SNUABM_28]QZE59130.1 hypothetical protein pEaSNUABM18_00227 [Erwinia phage pEa_SNUABM_18]UAW96371.1 hypothetical protein pEaSNUABM16_00227 [Erwinia phage pEa_SNUABM_16]UAW96714.1 hypothetical protein pEaSNUABM22_00227 [Erwinia phage pEa_SNUABM_22]
MAKLKKERSVKVSAKKTVAVKTKKAKAKAIPVRVVQDTRPIINCPEMEEKPQPFRFRGQCPIVTCQYCTRETPTGCMALDRKESADRSISNKEIAYYKRGLFPELKDMDQKQLDSTIRRAQNRTRNAICLTMFIAGIDDSDCDRSFQYVEGRSRLVDQVHNYLVQTFNDYRPWMLAYLDDEKRFGDMVGKITNSDFNLKDALRLTPRKYQMFCQSLQNLKQSGDSHE